MITTALLSFNKLTPDTLYEILAFRSSVFIVEQECFFQDLDYKDQDAIHLLMRKNEKLIGYARILAYDDNNMSFGRLITDPSLRKEGFGRKLMSIIMSFLEEHHPNVPVMITAQQYLKNFYEGYGFMVQGKPFMLDNQPHIMMVKS